MRHFSVEVISNTGEIVHTHQVITDKNLNTTITIFNDTDMKSSSKFTFDVPDVEKAFQYQDNIYHKSTGIYNLENNSCLTHTMDVLREGGVTDAPKNSTDAARFLRDSNYK